MLQKAQLKDLVLITHKKCKVSKIKKKKKQIRIFFSIFRYVRKDVYLPNSVQQSVCKTDHRNTGIQSCHDLPQVWQTIRTFCMQCNIRYVTVTLSVMSVGPLQTCEEITLSSLWPHPHITTASCYFGITQTRSWSLM